MYQLKWQDSLLVAVFFSPAHNADLMVGHGESHLLLKDSARIGIELGCDINATGDRAPSVDLRPQLVCLSDLQSAHAERWFDMYRVRWSQGGGTGAQHVSRGQ